MTKIFCTIADNKFSSRVLALNESLSRHNSDYTLYLLNIDNKKISAPNIENISFQNFLSDHDELRLNQNITPSKEALRLSKSEKEAKDLQLTWCMSPCFTNYCFKNFCKEDILYIDADIYFYNDWSVIYNDMPEKLEIGLVEHRMPWTGDSGKYNVGILYFKKTQEAEKCLDFWQHCVLHDTEYRDVYGTCGDQKYLELFPEKFKNVYSMDSYIGHLAPWNLVYHQYTSNQIVWKNKPQNLLYYHFSNFTPNFTDDTYIPAPRHHITSVRSIPLLHDIHETYYKALKRYE